MATNPKSSTIHINPKFRSVHINPNFFSKKPLVTIASNQIHVNPKFYNDYLHRPSGQSVSVPASQPSTSCQSTSTNKFSINRLPVTPIISKTNKQIVRQPLQPPKNSKPTISGGRITKPLLDTNPLIRNHSKSLVRQGALLKPANLSNKFVALRSKYSIDYRKVRSPQKIQSSGSFGSTTVIVNDYKLRRIAYSQQKSSQAAPRKWTANTSPLTKKLKLVSINGVFYKSSGSKLQRHSAISPARIVHRPSSINGPTPSKNLRLSGSKLRVRGALFLVEANGKKLRRIHDETSSETMLSSTPCKTRIDLGRMTFIATENNTFIRTDRHKTQAHLNVAKKHSIRVLRRTLVKSNVPCPIFRKVGKCQAHDRDRCNRLHDPKQVAICPKFLSGSCTVDGCTMSHAVSLAKMPVCRFFLKVMCSKNDCPYLHKKVNEAAEICPDFVKGYCERAEKCSKRHEFLCPDFESKGNCVQTRCPYAHRKKTINRPRKLTTTNIIPRLNSRNEEPSTVEGSLQSESTSRYFGNDKLDSKMEKSSKSTADKSATSTTTSMDTDESCDDNITLIPQRPRLGSLPSFIPIGR